MNIYVVVEGEKATKKLYQRWISLNNPNLTHIDYLRDLTNNCVFVFQGGGQPSYWDKVRRAVEDVNTISGFDRLVISVDSEDLSFEDKLLEANEVVAATGCRIEVRYIIQHFCLETWLLGNRNIFKKKTHNSDLNDYFNRFDLRSNNPELLPDYREKNMNRSQFAYRYLRTAIHDTHNGRKHYSKKDPGIGLEESFYHQVVSRCRDMNHINSFAGFLGAFI